MVWSGTVWDTVLMRDSYFLDWWILSYFSHMVLEWTMWGCTKRGLGIFKLGLNRQRHQESQILPVCCFLEPWISFSCRRISRFLAKTREQLDMIHLVHFSIHSSFINFWHPLEGELWSHGRWPLAFPCCYWPHGDRKSNWVPSSHSCCLTEEFLQPLLFCAGRPQNVHYSVIYGGNPEIHGHVVMITCNSHVPFTAFNFLRPGLLRTSNPPALLQEY